MAEPARPSDTDLELREGSLRLFHDWAEAKASAELWAERAAGLGQLLAARLAASNAKHATINGALVCTYYPAGTYRRFNEGRFKAALPDLWADYVEVKDRSAYVKLAGKWAGK